MIDARMILVKHGILVSRMGSTQKPLGMPQILELRIRFGVTLNFRARMG